MPHFAFDAHPVRLPAQFVPCNVPHWPAVTIVNTFVQEDVAGAVFDGQGGAFVLTREFASPTIQSALRLTYVTPAGVVRPTLDVHRPSLPAGTLSHTYYAGIAALGTGRCAVIWGEMNGALFVEGFDATGTRLFSNQVAPAITVPRLAVIASRGAGAVVAFFHATAGTRVLQVRFVSATGAISGGGLQWARAGSGFNDFNIPQIATATSGDLVVVWEENPAGGAADLSIFAQRIGGNGQLIGTAVPVATTADAWTSPRIRRAVSDGDGGVYVGSTDPAGRLMLTHMIRPSAGQATPAFWTVPISTLAHPGAFSIAPDGDTGAVLIASINAAGRLGVRRLDPQGNDPWLTMSARDMIGLSIQVMGGATADFFSHAVAVAASGTGGALVVYLDVATPVSATDVKIGLFYACVEANGRVSKYRNEIKSALFPAHMMTASAEPNAAIVAWQDHFASSSNTNVLAQKIDCCEGYLAEVYPWPPRPFRGIAVGYPLLPDHLPITLPARRGKTGYFGFLGLPQLANIPGVVLPGGLSSPRMPRPKWVQISFRDMPYDFTIELFTQRGDRVARAEPLGPLFEPVPGGTFNKQIAFQPTHPGVYILGIGYEGADFVPGERTLVRVSVEFGDDSPDPRKRSRRRGEWKKKTRGKKKSGR